MQQPKKLTVEDLKTMQVVKRMPKEDSTAMFVYEG